MTIKDAIEFTQIIVNIAIIGGIPFVAKLIFKALQEQKNVLREQNELLRLKNEYLEAVSVKDWREQLKSLRADYRERMKQLGNELAKSFGDIIIEMAIKARDEICYARIEELIKKHHGDIEEKDSNEKLEMFNKMIYNISHELLYADNTNQVFMRLPPDIKEAIEQSDSPVKTFIIFHKITKS